MMHEDNFVMLGFSCRSHQNLKENNIQGLLALFYGNV